MARSQRPAQHDEREDMMSDWPSCLREAFDRAPAAKAQFELLAASHQRDTTAWIEEPGDDAARHARAHAAIAALLDA
jgi:uncharacterized protein YdeI (YjbR/CyaY-like superfamily)